MADEIILRSWKEIANYLKCDRKTCARWEAQFGLPIHRIDPESPRSRVFAYAAELDGWMADRQGRPDSGEPSSENSPLPPKKRRFRSMALAAGILAVSAPVSWIVVKNVFRSPFPPVLAVTPFVSSNSEPEFDYIAEGLKSDLVRRLNMTGDVLVMVLPRNAADPEQTERGVPPLPKTDYTIRGTVERLSQDEFRWNLEVVDSENRELLWNNSWKIGIPDLPITLAEAVAGIRTALDLDETVRPASIARDVNGVLNDNLRASYLLSNLGSKETDPTRLYLEGVYYSGLGDQQANELAILSFQFALKKDPTFGPALIGLAGCYTNYLNFGWKTDLQWLDKAEDVLAKAGPSSLDNPEYYCQRIETLLLRDFFYGRESFDDYLSLAEKGLDINPYYGGLNSILGACYLRRFDLYGRESDLDEALRLKNLAHWAEPYSINNIVYAQILMMKRRFSEALDVCGLLKQNLDSDFVTLQAAEIHYYQGDLKACEPVFASLRENLADRSYALRFLGMIAAQRKDRAAALEALREIELSAPAKTDIQSGELRRASIYAGLGDAASASEILGRIFRPDEKNGGNYSLRRLIDLDRNFEEIRSRIKLYF